MLQRFIQSQLFLTFLNLGKRNWTKKRSRDIVASEEYVVVEKACEDDELEEGESKEEDESPVYHIAIADATFVVKEEKKVFAKKQSSFEDHNEENNGHL